MTINLREICQKAHDTKIGESLTVDYSNMDYFEAANISAEIMALDYTWRVHPVKGLNALRYERIQ